MYVADRIAVMNHGVIEQLGTADEIYNRPRTLYVGRFVGESNIFTASISGNGGTTLQAEVRGVGRFRGVAPSAIDIGREAKMLLRPESLRLVEAGSGESTPADTNRFSARVERVIYLGHRTEYHLRVGEEKLVVWELADRTRRVRKEGDSLTVEVAVADTFLFDD